MFSHFSLKFKPDCSTCNHSFSFKVFRMDWFMPHEPVHAEKRSCGSMSSNLAETSAMVKEGALWRDRVIGSVIDSGVGYQI
jgi:hypothetical protein